MKINKIFPNSLAKAIGMHPGDRLLKIKRRGRKSTKLKSLEDELTLSKKTLLG